MPAATFLSDQHRYRAQQDPDGVCWIFGDDTWTWGRAWDDIRRFAGALRVEGVRRGDRIAFIDKGCPGLLMALHAASLIGAANAVPSWRPSGDELVDILNDSGAKVLFLGHEFVHALQPVRDRLSTIEKVIVVGGEEDELDAWIATGEPLNGSIDVAPQDPCLVMYTSGTTGRPKGALLTHANLMAHTRNAAGLVEPGEGHQLLIAAPMFHTYGLFGAATGTPGVFVRDVCAQSLIDAVQAGLTHVFLVPAQLASLLRAGPEVTRPLGRLSALSYGAAPISPTVLRDALAAWPDTRFAQVYGMVELVAAVTLLDDAAHRDPEHPERLASAGTALPGVEVRVVDVDTLEDVAPGASGELWFRTEQSTPGYVFNDRATAEMRTDDGWVRSGDVGRVDDGYVFVEDRVKDMIIAGPRAENVFSCEVERVLSEHASVLELAVIGVPDDQRGEAVKAVVVFHPEKDAEPEDLIAFARERLAPHKVPTTFDIAESLPRGASGKVLKRQLRDPYWAGRERQI